MGEEWASLQAYRTSLDPDSTDHHALGGGTNQNLTSGAVGPTGRGRGRPRRPRPEDTLGGSILFFSPFECKGFI